MRPELENLLKKYLVSQKRKRNIRIAGIIIILIAYGLIFYFFSWKLALILFLIQLSNNLENYGKNNY